MNKRLLILLSSLILLVAPSNLGAEQVWGALILGTQQEAATPDRLKPYEGMLKKVFGYKNFTILGQSSKKFSQSQETWIIPSNELFLRVSGKGGNGKYRMNVQLYHGKKLLVETDTKMAKDKPFLIRGPQWGNGQLILMLVVK